MHTSNSAAVSYFTSQLGVSWYIDYTADYSTVPAGVNKVVYMSLSSSSGNTCASILNSMAVKPPPGSYWYIGGEPNTTPTSISGTDFAPIFHDCYTVIKAYDPTAKIMSPSILNWWWQCSGCGGTQAGYIKGEVWTADFINTYESAYGQPPPVDVWNIDIYPIDWYRTPNADWQLAVGQIQGDSVPGSIIGHLPCKGNHPFDPNTLSYSGSILGTDNAQCTSMQPSETGMREYLDSIQDSSGNYVYKNTPIWITEMAMHWGYQGWQFANNSSSSISPTGNYCAQQVATYLDNLVTWLKANSSAYNIGKWFQFVTYADLANTSIPDYAGISLFNSPTAGSATLTPEGQIYKDLAHGSSTSVNISSLYSCP